MARSTALLAGALALASAPASAQPSGPAPTLTPLPGAASTPERLARQLSVARGQGADDCPAAPALAEAVAPLLAGPLDPGVRVDVQIGRGPGGYEAHVRTSGLRPGRRRLADASDRCGPLADALAVVTAMMLDGRDSPEPPAPSLAPPTAPAPAPAPGPSLAARLALESTLGVVARGSSGPAVELSLDLPSGASLGLGGSYLLPAAYDEPPGEVTVSLAALRARACWLGRAHRAVAVGGCALGWLGRMRGAGSGYFLDQAQAVTWTAAGLGLTATGRPDGGWGWLGEAGLLVPGRRQSFSVERVSDGPVFEPAALGVFARLGVWAKIF